MCHAGPCSHLRSDVRGPVMQVKNAGGQWVSAKPIPGTLVCNIGDMLRVWTHGLYQVAGSPFAGLLWASPLECRV